MKRNSEYSSAFTPEDLHTHAGASIRERITRAISGVALVAPAETNQGQGQLPPTPKGPSAIEDYNKSMVTDEAHPIVASEQLHNEVAADLESNPLLDSPVSESRIFEYMLAQRVLVDALEEKVSGVTPEARRMSIMRSAFGLLTHSSLEQKQPIPIGMNDAYTIAQAIDRTKPRAEEREAQIAEDWHDLRTATLQLLKQREQPGAFNPHDILIRAFNVSERKDTNIIDEYRKIELGNYTVIKTLSEVYQGLNDEPTLGLYRNLATLHKAGTLATDHEERKQLGADLAHGIAAIEEAKAKPSNR